MTFDPNHHNFCIQLRYYFWFSVRLKWLPFFLFFSALFVTTSSCLLFAVKQNRRCFCQTSRVLATCMWARCSHNTVFEISKLVCDEAVRSLPIRTVAACVRKRDCEHAACGSAVAWRSSGGYFAMYVAMTFLFLPEPNALMVIHANRLCGVLGMIKLGAHCLARSIDEIKRRRINMSANVASVCLVFVYTAKTL